MIDWILKEGSSPLVRGKLQLDRLLIGSLRLIPAGAGKTDRGFSRHACKWAHPRWCGENKNEVDEIETVTGSSPLVRGKQPINGVGGDSNGLIPAGAGKTHP